MSVPSQKSADGGFRRLAGETACGSIVPSHGARNAMATMTMSMTPPTSAVGWRLNASRKRRHGGDTDLVATGAARAVVLISITYPRMEQHVRKIDRQIEQPVDRGKNQDHALDDGIVAAQDGVDGEAADA